MKRKICDMLLNAIISRIEPGMRVEEALSPELCEKLCMLNRGQQEAIARVLSSKTNYSFCTGGAGCGKSFMVDVLVMLCTELNVKALVTSTTGKSAMVINGRTIYSALEISPEMLLSGILKKKASAAFEEAELVIVDEVSMMAKILFEKAVEKYAKGRKKILFVGDLLQLPPVEKQAYSRYEAFRSKLFAYAGSAMDILYLDEIVRQDDPEFINYLNEARFGIYNPELNEKLDKEWYGTKKGSENLHRIAEYLVEEHKKGREVKYLAAVKEFVDIVNDLCLQKLGYTEDQLTVYDVITETYEDLSKVKEENRPIVEECIKKALKENEQDTSKEYKPVKLCIGQAVMITVNERVRPGCAPRYANGTDGVVKGLYDDHVDVKLKSGEVVEISYVRIDHSVRYTGADGEQYIFPYKTVSYMPLITSYACTIHKSQGLTLDEVFLDPRRCKAPGQLYTGLSRVKRMKDIHLTAPVQRENVVADIDCVAFYRYIKDHGVSYDDATLYALEKRFLAVDEYTAIEKKVKKYLDNDMPEYISDSDRYRYSVSMRDKKRLYERISNIIMFNEYYNGLDTPDPRLPYMVIEGIKMLDEDVLHDWLDGKYDACLDPEAYGLPLLVLPKIPISKAEAAFYLDSRIFWEFDEDAVYDDETIADYEQLCEDEMKNAAEREEEMELM